MSDGNGHPYSWSAIFNGYNADYMKDCPFGVILEYLSKQNFPNDAIPYATVTHIWTQDLQISEHIAKSANISNIVAEYSDMIGQVDAVLLARDDPKNHYMMAKPFLEAGVPIFIDKPLATSLDEANKMYQLEQYEGQLYSCSSLRFAREFKLTDEVISNVGEIKLLDAIIPKSWEKYAVHIIEPALQMLKSKSKLSAVTNTGSGSTNIVTARWDDGTCAIFKVLGSTSCPLHISIYGTDGHETLKFKDTYYAFKTSLEHFIESVRSRHRVISKQDTLDVIEIIEKGFLTQ